MPGLMLSGGSAFAPPSTVTSTTAAAHRRLRPSSSGQGCADGPVSPIYAIRVLEATTHSQSVKTPPHTLGASTGDKGLSESGPEPTGIAHDVRRCHNAVSGPWQQSLRAGTPPPPPSVSDRPLRQKGASCTKPVASASSGSSTDALGHCPSLAHPLSLLY